MHKIIDLGVKKIGAGQPCFIVAEMSGNHNQDIRRAYKIIDAAAESGADAIKLQTYTPDTLTINSQKKWFWIKKGSKWGGQTLYDLYRKIYTPWDWHPKLKAYAERQKLIFFSTPFDESAVKFLETLNVKLYKVASFENEDISLLMSIGKTNKPVILSRGLSSLLAIKRALSTLRRVRSNHVAVLHCIIAYPAPLEQMNLATLPDLHKKLKVITGLSDHSLGDIAAITSIAQGGKIIEKHLTLSRADGGVDAKFSLEPHEFKHMVTTIRDVEKAIGHVRYTPNKNETQNILYKRSLFTVSNIVPGEKFTNDNVRSIRPGYGLSPRFYNQILGKKSTRRIPEGTPLRWIHIAK